MRLPSSRVNTAIWVGRADLGVVVADAGASSTA